jgi:hypothetical protein
MADRCEWIPAIAGQWSDEEEALEAVMEIAERIADQSVLSEATTHDLALAMVEFGFEMFSYALRLQRDTAKWVEMDARAEEKKIQSMPGFDAVKAAALHAEANAYAIVAKEASDALLDRDIILSELNGLRAWLFDQAEDGRLDAYLREHALRNESVRLRTANKMLAQSLQLMLDETDCCAIPECGRPGTHGVSCDARVYCDEHAPKGYYEIPAAQAVRAAANALKDVSGQ